jgi:hypothetical protein
VWGKEGVEGRMERFEIKRYIALRFSLWAAGDRKINKTFFFCILVL